MDTEAGWMDGGDSGVVIDLEKPATSLLLKAISHDDPDLQIAAEVQTFCGRDRFPHTLDQDRRSRSARWRTEEGPQNQNRRRERGARSGAFQPPAEQTPPAVKTRSWARDPIDQYVLAGLEAEEIEASGRRGSLHADPPPRPST